MAIVPLLAIGATLFFLPDERRQYRDHIVTHSIWNQVNTGPYGARPGISYEVASHIFPKQYLDSHEYISRVQGYAANDPTIDSNFTVPLSVVEQLWTYHPNINWRQSYLKSLRKTLQLYKYGYVFKDVTHLTNHIMAMALIGNTDKWFALYAGQATPFASKDFSYSNYPISYSEDDLGQSPAPSMIDPTKSRTVAEYR